MIFAFRTVNAVMKRKILIPLLAIICMPVLAQLDADATHNSVVRVVVDDGGEVGVASGFVWKEKNLVITSLHAVRPKPAKITVECRDTPYKARVHKFFRDADLVLLETEADMASCSPLSKIRPESPKLDGKTRLTAFGFKPDVTASTTKDLRRGSASSNKLRDLITDDLVIPMQTLNLPSIDLEVHFVTGGIYKGYSGGPVFDENGDLVGIVEGGLDKGMSDHNWLIPAENIALLLGSSPVDDAPADLNDAAYYYSVVRSKRTSPESYIEFEDSGYSYRWLKTKTRSFEQLRQSSDPAEGLEDLWATLLPEVETSAEGNLQFDIYEEEGLGLVIAVPAGRPLVYQQEDGDWTLGATDTSGEQATMTIQHGRYQFEDANGDAIDPSHDDFFEFAVDSDLKVCESEALTCSLQDEHFRLVDFGAGNRILRVGYDIENESDGDRVYLYKSLIVKGDNVLVVETILNFGEGSTVLRCFEEGSAENCGESFWGPASFMLSAALTSISSLGVEGIEPVVITPFDYECENCEEDPADTIEEQAQAESYYSEAVSAPVVAAPDGPAGLVYYFLEDGEIAFQHVQGTDWFINVNGEPVEAIEQRRDTLDGAIYAFLLYGTSSYAVPITGGYYFTAVPGGEWVQASAVYPLADEVPELTVTYYLEEGEIAFQQVVEGSDWLINVNGEAVDATEVERELWTDDKTYAILQYGTSSYAVPLVGGQYYTAVAGGSWTPARVVQIVQ
ncbi:MAG: serine protease [Halioglobus sp.]